MPSSHSSSSHSSSSRSSSSHSSSSHSSSSHSSSSHSSSWGSSRSSGSSWGSSGSSGGFWGRSRSSPSRHSESSHSSEVYRSHYVRGGSMEGRVIERSRSNQPQGYVAREHYNVEPIPHYGVKHNYLYYPLSWTDAATGREYPRGYYDENGAYYDNVVFRQTDGVYKNVVCQCEYCDTVSKIDWTEGGPLICPQCGGTMKILSKLDEYTQDPLYRKIGRRRDAGGSRFSPYAAMAVIALIFIFVIAVFAGIRDSYDERKSNLSPYDGGYDYGGNEMPPDPVVPVGFGEAVYLKDLGSGAFSISDESDYDRVLIWDEDEESYYEAESQLWAWFNTDVTPPLWQYWYEPISQDYGDYGWMEYEKGVWFIEANAGNWIQVPRSYDTTPLWHIETRSPEDPEPPLVPDSPENSANSEEEPEDDSAEELQSRPYHGGDSEENLNVPLMFNEVIYLNQTASDAYVITGDYDHDLEPVWNDTNHCYYEPETGMWLWYNIYADSPHWQYWYGPISGNYRSAGWLEYENGSWYLENPAGEWIPLPEEYDASPLWHIDAEPAD